jgi:hypothetical protein
MTTRFSVAEMAEMLHTSVHAVRAAVEDLSRQQELTRETFTYGDRNWRIAPSDSKRIQQWIEKKAQAGELTESMPQRRVRKKQVLRDE